MEMERTFVYLKKFSDKLDALDLTDDDLIPLEKHLSENPSAGSVIRGTGGLRKLRWTLDTGKSGGIRVLYVDVIVKEQIYMIDVFSKSEKDNLTDAERNAMKQVVSKLKRGE